MIIDGASANEQLVRNHLLCIPIASILQNFLFTWGQLFNNIIIFIFHKNSATLMYVLDIIY
ncbi:hypothetical protein D3C77_782760 [compost metagenome]